MGNIALEDSWKQYLLPEFTKPYMQALKTFLLAEHAAKKVIYPKGSDLFKAFWLTPVAKVKVVILGQDPYHGPDQAHGLCFSVLPKIALPPSLLNIYKELYNDLGILPANHGCLVSWAKQGVLLLNSILTVQAGMPGSHANKGWEVFTDQVMRMLNLSNNKIIFLLWGNYAIQKGKLIDPNKHVVLQAAHPSPFSAHKGFLGCKHFSQVNKLLSSWGQTPINWQL